MTDENENLCPPTDGGVDPASGTGAFFTPKEALDAVMANPPFPRGGEPWRNLDDMEACGIRRNGNVIIAWAIHERCAVVVRANRRFDGWAVVASVDCEKALEATVYGGVTRVNKVVKEMRNALLAAWLRRLHHKMNRAARRAKAAETEAQSA